jgi:hypothetical protein
LGKKIPTIKDNIKITGSPECPCKHGTPTVGRLIFQCNRLKNEREKLKTSVLYLE